MNQVPIHLQQPLEQVTWVLGHLHDDLLQNQNRILAIDYQILDAIFLIIHDHQFFRLILTNNRHLHLKEILFHQIKLLRH